MKPIERRIQKVEKDLNSQGNPNGECWKTWEDPREGEFDLFTKKDHLTFKSETEMAAYIEENHPGPPVNGLALIRRKIVDPAPATA